MANENARQDQDDIMQFKESNEMMKDVNAKLKEKIRT